MSKVIMIFRKVLFSRVVLAQKGLNGWTCLLKNKKLFFKCIKTAYHHHATTYLPCTPQPTTSLPQLKKNKTKILDINLRTPLIVITTHCDFNLKMLHPLDSPPTPPYY